MKKITVEGIKKGHKIMILTAHPDDLSLQGIVHGNVIKANASTITFNSGEVVDRGRINAAFKFNTPKRLVRAVSDIRALLEKGGKTESHKYGMSDVTTYSAIRYLALFFSSELESICDAHTSTPPVSVSGLSQDAFNTLLEESFKHWKAFNQDSKSFEMHKEQFFKSVTYAGIKNKSCGAQLALSGIDEELMLSWMALVYTLQTEQEKGGVRHQPDMTMIGVNTESYARLFKKMEKFEIDPIQR